MMIFKFTIVLDLNSYDLNILDFLFTSKNTQEIRISWPQNDRGNPAKNREITECLIFYAAFSSDSKLKLMLNVKH